MKRLILALCLISTAAIAQTPPVPAAPPRRLALPLSAPSADGGELLPGNYLVKLAVTDKDQEKTELSVVVSTTSPFNVSATDVNLTLGGTLVLQEDGAILFRYGLGVQTAITEGPSTSYRSSNCNSSVRLRSGETVQIFKSGTISYKLTISKLGEEKKKEK